MLNSGECISINPKKTFHSSFLGFKLYNNELNHLILKGSSEKPGLAALAMADILSLTEKDGNSVTISSYEVYQDHVYDILDPERKVVLVQGDAQGKIRLKGLSQASYLVFSM